MAFDLKSISRNNAALAPRVMLYGVEGVGKALWRHTHQSPSSS
jgi:hypothetical protein